MNKFNFILSSVVLASIIFTSCRESSQSNGSSSKVIGIDSKTVTIGSQVWMSQNLDVGKFRNGDPIPHAKTDEEWRRAGENKQPAWCYYDNDPANGEKYGKLYNWYAVNDSRGLAPNGYHIPTYEEWLVLNDYLGGYVTADNKMKSTSGWDENGNGTNSSRFSGLPGGCRYVNGGYSSIRRNGCWWSASEGSALDATSLFGTAWNRDLFYNNQYFGDYVDKRNGFSVRCLKD